MPALDDTPASPAPREGSRASGRDVTTRLIRGLSRARIPGARRLTRAVWAPRIGLLADGVDDANQRLASLIQAMDRKFQRTTADLEEMTEHSHQLVAESEHLLSLASGRSEGEAVLESAMGMLQPPLDFLADCTAAMERVIASLERCQTHTARLLTYRTEWQTVVSPLRFIRSLVKIEAASLPAELQQMFASVALDIERLEQEATVMFAEKFEVIGSMHQIIDDVAGHLRAVLPQQQRLTTEKRARIRTTLDELQLELEHNAQRDLQLSVTSKSIAREVEKIVVGLQFHDIVRQKSEHIDAALADLSVRMRATDTTPPRELHDHADAIAHGARLQEAQIAGLLHDLVEARGQIEGGMTLILAAVRELEQHHITLQDLNKVTMAADGMIQILLETLEESRELVGTTLANADESYERINPIGAVMQKLTSSMSEVEVSMLVIALNAQIQAVQNGAGTGLEVLALNTAEISRRTSQLSAHAFEELGHLRTTLDDAIAELSAVRQQGQGHRDMLAQQGLEKEGELHGLRDRSLNFLRSIAEHASHVQRLSTNILGSLDLSAAAAALEPARGSLRAVAACADEIDALALAAAGRTRGAPAAHYTMASEREIHAAVTRGAAVVPRQSQVDHAGAHTELFGDDSAPPRESPGPRPGAGRPTPPPAAGSDSNIELF